MQMLVAAFNPSSTSETQIGVILFADEANKKGLSSVFRVGTSCHDAIQGGKKQLAFSDARIWDVSRQKT